MNTLKFLIIVNLINLGCLLVVLNLDLIIGG